MQGKLDAKSLTAWLAGPGSFVADDEGEIVGAGLLADAETFAQGLPAAARMAATEAGWNNMALWGPVVVKKSHRRQGISSKLWESASTNVIGQFDAAIAFIEERNSVSLAVHMGSNWEKVASFTHGDRTYRVIGRSIA